MTDVDALRTKLDAEICPECGQHIGGYEQVGRCVYSTSCGHRLYQGTVPYQAKPRLPLKYDDGYCRCCGCKGCDCVALCECEQHRVHCVAHHQEG